MKNSFLTLNIGAAGVELAEYAQGAGGRLTLVKYGKTALDAPLDAENAELVLTPALTALVREHGFKPGKVELAISGQMVFPKFSALPMASGDEKFEQLVRYEIEQNIPFPIDEMVCDRQVLGETENGDRAVMIVAAKVDQIEAIATAVQAAGFIPELVDAAPLAVTNVVRYNRDGDESCVVVLDIGAKTTSLMIVEGDRVYTRSIPVAGNQLTKEISTALGCTQEEAEAIKLEKGYVSLGGVAEDADEVADRVAKVSRSVMTRLQAEISRSVNFYRSQQHGNAPTAIYLTGGTALLPQLDQFFAEALGVEVAYLNPFERIGVGAGIDEEALGYDGACLAATAGVALHHAGAAHFMINLLPPSLKAARAERARLPFLIAGGVMLVAALFVVAMALNRKAAVIEAQRDGVQGRLTTLQNFDKRIVAEDQKLVKAQAAADELEKLMLSRSRVVAQLAAVRGALLPGMWISRWENGRITIRSWNDRVKGSAGKTVGEVVADKLKRSSAVADDGKGNAVRIADMSTIGSQVEQFTLEVKFK